MVTGERAAEGAFEARAGGSLLSAAWRWLPTGRSLPLADWRVRHRWLVGLLWAHVVALPTFAIVRGEELDHTLLEGAGLGLLAAGATFLRLAPRWRAALAALGLVTSSAVLVHVWDGYIEAHFHFFVVILILTLYEDWIPFLVALGYVVAHHGVAGQLDATLVYNHPDALAHPWKWAMIHGAFVLAASVGAVIAWRLNEDARARAGEAMAQAVRSGEANEMKNRFIATTSHELRTPLTSIGGFATTLRHRWHEVKEEDKLQMLDIIDAQSARLQTMIDDLLMLSSLESGNLPVRQALVDVGPALEQLVRELPADGGLAVEAEHGLVARVDERHLSQIVANFVANARKYGAPPITLAARADGRWVELEVSDCGDGVPEEFVPQLFDMFTRAPEAVSVNGSGLGLSIVRGLAEANGGEVWYEQNGSKGASFRARLPRAVGHVRVGAGGPAAG